MAFLGDFMDSATKYYKKALIKYHKGYIDEAINLCAASVAENNKYKAAASLKGILFYFKGDLENARELWDFNVRVNKDVVSKKYIENTRFDDKLLSIYAKGVALISEVRIADALILLKECQESDFNVINVSNYIAVCFIKQGEFNKAKINLDKVLNIDRKNKMAKDNIKMLKKYGIINSKFGRNPIIIFLILALILGGSLSVHFFKSKKTGIVSKIGTVKQVDKPKVTAPKKIKPNEIKQATPIETFPYDKLKTYIDEGNYDEIDKQLNLWKNKSIDNSDKALLQNALVSIQNNGLRFFYSKANQYSIEKDYKNAFDYYYKVYSYGNMDYLYESGLFYLGKSKQNLNSINDALKYYEEYSNTFPTGSYEATVLYNLASLYSKSDSDKAKIFAKILLKNFPDSEYNNTDMKEVLAN